jgi:formylglycine-generating enzyme required for sulfatase activity
MTNRASFFLPLFALGCAVDDGGVAGNGGATSIPDGSSVGGSAGWTASGGNAGTASGGAAGESGTGGAPADMVLIPGGSFTMGCTSQTFCYCDEYPSRQINLSEFYIDRTEVTREAYGKCVSLGACTPPVGDPTMSFAENADHPVVNVDWNQANQYCLSLGKHLPSGAQWERAYRGTDGRTLPWGGTVLDCSYANYGDCALNTTSPVGSHPAGASAEGVLDLAGNVWEWLADGYSDGYYQDAAARDPGGPANGLGHEYRGGGFKTGADRLYPYLRYYDDWDGKHQQRMIQLGFRCAYGGVTGTPYTPACSCPDPYASPVCS